MFDIKVLYKNATKSNVLAKLHKRARVYLSCFFCWACTRGTRAGAANSIFVEMHFLDNLMSELYECVFKS